MGLFAEGSVSSAFIFVAAAVAAVMVTVPAVAVQRDESGQDPHPVENFPAFDKPNDVDEGKAIKPIDLPFLQHIDDWERSGHGISMSSMGEPKSGTTWTERIITELALELCGSSTNTWCKMGGLRVIPNVPDPSYRWEMVHADTGELFIHFDGKIKHSIPGLQVGEDCNPRGRAHSRAFGAAPPCRVNVMINRESIESCLPITSEECLKRMPSRDPSVRRTTVIFRDPRDIVISERRMRAEVFGRGKANNIPLVPFINKRFKRIVSWQLIRWVWHTTVYKDESYIMLYEDLQANSKALIDLASFMGLDCSEEQARAVWEKHRNQSPHGSFNSYDLPEETVKFMNATMLDLLPYEMIFRYKPTLMSG